MFKKGFLGSVSNINHTPLRRSRARWPFLVPFWCRQWPAHCGWAGSCSSFLQQSLRPASLQGAPCPRSSRRQGWQENSAQDIPSCNQWERRTWKGAQATWCPPQEHGGTWRGREAWAARTFGHSPDSQELPLCGWRQCATWGPCHWGAAFYWTLSYINSHLSYTRYQCWKLLCYGKAVFVFWQPVVSDAGCSSPLHGPLSLQICTSNAAGIGHPHLLDQCDHHLAPRGWPGRDLINTCHLAPYCLSQKAKLGREPCTSKHKIHTKPTQCRRLWTKESLRCYNLKLTLLASVPYDHILFAQNLNRFLIYWKKDLR